MKLRNEHSIVHFTIGVLFAIITEKTFCQESRLDNLKYRHKSHVIYNTRLPFHGKGDIRYLPVLPHDPMNRHLNESALPHDYYFDRLSDHSLNPLDIYLPDRSFNTFKKLSLGSPMGVREEWARIYESRTLPSWDYATDLAVDKEGNVYVTGYSTNMPHGTDYYTIKYDADGNEIWSEYFNGEVNGDDLAQKIALDSEGNVYVGGSSTGAATGYDIVIVKYNNQGQQQWAARFDGPLHNRDYLGNMKVDESRNVYFTSMYENHVATVKMNSEGIQQWTAYYIGLGDHAFPTAMDTDSRGNVYIAVADKKYESEHHKAYTTIKYDPEGFQEWEAHYTESDSSYDYPNAIAVDKAENVYVTGTSYVNNNSNYVTIKYDENGQELWTAAYNGNENDEIENYTAGLILDDEGNVYVTGSSEDLSGNNTFDIVTVKYDSEGIQQWAVRYEEANGDDNRARAIGMDSVGNIRVFGYKGSDGTMMINYDTYGNQLSSTFFDIQSHVSMSLKSSFMNGQGELFITGNTIDSETESDYITIKFNQDGTHEWNARFNGNNRSESMAKDMVLDDNGNIYVYGSVNHELTIIKYNSQGTKIWDAPCLSREYFHIIDKSLAVDPEGNVFLITVHRQDSLGVNYQFLTEKFNPNGVRQWAVYYDEHEYPFDRYKRNFPVAVAADQAGNAYVMGRSLGEFGNSDIVTIKYNKDGVIQWENRLRSGENRYGDVADMIIDDMDNIYVASELHGEEFELVVVKYDAQGEEKWMKTYNEAERFYSISMELDVLGNIYLFCNIRTNYWLDPSGNIDDYVILKYSPDGMNQWVVHCNESGHPFCGEDIGVDVFGNVYVCGYCRNDFPSIQFVTKKYNTDGALLWTARDAYFDKWGYSEFLVLDNFGNAYVAGNGMNAGTGYDVMIVKYDPCGEEKWSINYNDPRNASDRTRKLGIDHSGNVYAAVTTGGYYWDDLKTIKFSQTGEDSLGFYSTAGVYRLKQNIPNPFNRQTLIYYSLPRPGRVKITIFNSIGQEVAYEDLGQKSSGHHAFHFMSDQLSTGIYFYRMEANDFIKTRKMILIQ